MQNNKLMICENAGRCEVLICGHVNRHEYFHECSDYCTKGIKGSKCIPYVEEDKGYWYCEECSEEICSENVTFQDKHDRCGYSVCWIDPVNKAPLVGHYIKEIDSKVEKMEDYILDECVNTVRQEVDFPGVVKRICSLSDNVKIDSKVDHGKVIATRLWFKGRLLSGKDEIDSATKIINKYLEEIK